MAAHSANIGVTDAARGYELGYEPGHELGHELGHDEEARPRPVAVRPEKAFRSFFGKASRMVERRSAKRGVHVRCFPNDDIYFHVKRIDNSRVVRQADPKTGGVCWRLIGSVAAAAMLLIGVLLPSAYGLLAGYQIQSLKEESKRLENQQASLELEEARLLSPERMEQLAREQQFIDPEPQKVVYLESAHAVAMNQGASNDTGLDGSGSQPKK
jgi:cell division protein FtsL